MKIRKINISSIKIAKTRRRLDENTVNALAESIELLGLLSPIIVSNHLPPRLLAGHHRLAAYKLLAKRDKSFQRIPSIVADDAHNLIEIEENLTRNELNPLERGIQLYKKKLAYARIKNPQRKFTAEVSRHTKSSIRTIERCCMIGEWLMPFERRIQALPALENNQTELLTLAAAKDSTLINNLLTVIENGQATTVDKAHAILKHHRDTNLYGYPVIRDDSKRIGYTQFNFQLLHSQKRFVERTLLKASEETVILPIKAKNSNANNLVKICDFYLRHHP